MNKAHKKRTGGPRKAPTNPDHNLRRIDNEETATRAWIVIIKRRGRAVHKYFTDNIHGGRRKARLAARAWRDEMLKKLSDANYVVWRRNIPQRRNRTGIVGIGCYERVRSKGGKPYRESYWQAFWHDADGERHTKSFSVTTYGETRSKALAMEAREIAMRKVQAALRRRGVVYGA